MSISAACKVPTIREMGQNECRIRIEEAFAVSLINLGAAASRPGNCKFFGPSNLERQSSAPPRALEQQILEEAGFE